MNIFIKYLINYICFHLYYTMIHILQEFFLISMLIMDERRYRTFKNLVFFSVFDRVMLMYESNLIIFVMQEVSEE